MADMNLAILFGGVLAGGVVIHYGVQHTKTAFASAGTSSTATSGSSSGGAIPGGKLNANQTVFANELAAKTGLDPKVIAGWMLSEEPASASSAPNGANNWLNIGATDSGFYGAGNPAWQTPQAAADFTAQWLRGTTAPGFGVASAGIQRILSSAGQSVSAQIAAIQNSGWASSGYPNLPSVVASI